MGKLRMYDVLDRLAEELGVSWASSRGLSSGESKLGESGSATSDLDDQLCVKDVLEKHCDEIYRFCTDDHGMRLNEDQRSYNELRTLFKELKDPSLLRDGGSFPEVRKAGKWSAGTLYCTCKACATGIPVELFCEPYAFAEPVEGTQSKHYVLIHKFIWGEETWAVILGDMREEPMAYRLWGAYEYDTPDQISYCDRVLLRESELEHSEDEQSADPMSSKGRRAAQQTIEAGDTQQRGLSRERVRSDDGFQEENEELGHTLVRKRPQTRIDKTQEARKKKQRRSRKLDWKQDHIDDAEYCPRPTASRSRPAPESADYHKCSECGMRKTPRWRTGPEGPKTLCNTCGNKTKEVHITNTTNTTPVGTANEENAIKRTARLSAMNVFKFLKPPPKGSKASGLRTPPVPAAPPVPAPTGVLTAQIQPVPSALSQIAAEASRPETFIYTTAYQAARSYVHEQKLPNEATPGESISAFTNPGVRDAFRTLSSVFKDSDKWGFEEAYEMLNEKLAIAGVAQLPPL